MDRIARIAPSARLEQQIEELLTKGLGEASEHLAELGRLGARLVLQRAVDEEVAAFLGYWKALRGMKKVPSVCISFLASRRPSNTSSGTLNKVNFQVGA